MAVVDASAAPFGISTDDANVGNLNWGTIRQATGNSIAVSNGSHMMYFTGSFTYDSTGRYLTGGTLTAFSETQNGALLYAVSGLNVSATTFVNWVYSNANTTARQTMLSGADVMVGSGYSDTLRGYGGNDTIYGGGGHDDIDGGAGQNVIDGGSGWDTVLIAGSYSTGRLINYNGTIIAIDSGIGRNILTNVEYVEFAGVTYEMSSAISFDPVSYIAANRDLAAAFGSNAEAGLNHYLNSGYAERRATSFDALGYIAANPDLIVAFGTNTAAATAHYIANGRSEGRQTSFNASGYLAAYSDLSRALGGNTQSATLHYINNGYREGRLVPTTRSAMIAELGTGGGEAGLLAAAF